METRQQELYSSVLSDAVVDWGNMGVGEEWVNTKREGKEHGPRDEGTAQSSDGKRSARNSFEEDVAQLAPNGGRDVAESADWHVGKWGRTAAAAGEEEEEEEGSEVPTRAEGDWGRSTPCLPGDWAAASTWDMQLDTADLLYTEPLREADEDQASEGNLNYSIMTEEEREEMMQELAKLEEEISTLKQVLLSKEKRYADLRQKLGISPLGELKTNITRGWHDVQTSVAYKKTSETLSTAGQKTSAAFTNLGTAISRKLGDMSMFGLELLYPRRSNSIGYSIRHSMSMPTMRNSPSFKSFEEKVESTVTNIKTKVGGTEPGGSFEEVLSSAANASAQDNPNHNLTDNSERPC